MRDRKTPKVLGNQANGALYLRDKVHSEFASMFGFPSFYGKNMNSWIDCMTSLDEPSHAVSTIHAPADGVVILQIASAADLCERLPEIHDALIDCSAFVNWRRLETGRPPVLALSFYA